MTGVKFSKNLVNCMNHSYMNCTETKCLHALHFCFSIVISFIYFFQTWRQHKEGDPWPGIRSHHIAACLGYEVQPQRLLISGGAGDGITYDDMWLMDPQSGRMEKVRTNLKKQSCSFCLGME